LDEGHQRGGILCYIREEKRREKRKVASTQISGQDELFGHTKFKTEY
jgi:hypothetical protein